MPSRVGGAGRSKFHEESMNLRRLPKFVFSFLAFTLILAARGAEAPVKPIVDESLYSGMKWRLVGPLRGGGAPAVEGVAGEPNFFFFGGVARAIAKNTPPAPPSPPFFHTYRAPCC